MAHDICADQQLLQLQDLRMTPTNDNTIDGRSVNTTKNNDEKQSDDEQPQENYNCLLCTESVTADDRTIECSRCCTWHHYICEGLAKKEIEKYENDRSLDYTCSTYRHDQIGQTSTVNQQISNQDKTHLSLTSNSISGVDITTLALPLKCVAVPNRDGHLTKSNARQAQIRQASSLNQRISNQGKSHLSLTSNSISGVDITTLALPLKCVAVPNRDGHLTKSNARQAQIRQTSSLNQRISNQGKSHLSLTSNSISGVDTTTLALPSKRVAVPNRDGYMTESNTRQVQIRQTSSLNQRISNQGKTHLSLTSNSISGVDTTTLALPSKRVAVPNLDGHMTESNARQAPTPEQLSLQQSNITNDTNTAIDQNDNNYINFDNSASGQIRTSDQLKEMETKLKQREKALSKKRERCKENGN